MMLSTEDVFINIQYLVWQMCGFVFFVTHSWCNPRLPACHSWFSISPRFSGCLTGISATRDQDICIIALCSAAFLQVFTGRQKSVVRSETRHIRFRFFSLQGKGHRQDAQPLEAKSKSVFILFISFYILWQIWFSRCHRGCRVTRAVLPPGCSVWQKDVTVLNREVGG